jgi:CBS domain-containing protein
MTAELVDPIGPAVTRRRHPRADPDATLRQVCQIMATDHLDAVLLDRPGRPVAVLTTTDVAEALAAGADPDVVWAADVVSRPSVYVDAAESIDEAARRALQRGGDHVVVTDEDGLVGLVSLRELLELVLGQRG